MSSCGLVGFVRRQATNVLNNAQAIDAKASDFHATMNGDGILERGRHDDLDHALLDCSCRGLKLSVPWAAPAVAPASLWLFLSLEFYQPSRVLCKSWDIKQPLGANGCPSSLVSDKRDWSDILSTTFELSRNFLWSLFEVQTEALQ